MIADPIDACRFYLHDTSETIFTEEQIQEFLDMEKVPDEDGYRPEHDDYTPTYDVLRAAGRGWLWLAGEVGNKAISYSVGDVSVSIDPAYCRSRARELLGAVSVSVPRRDERDKRLSRDGPDPGHRS